MKQVFGQFISGDTILHRIDTRIKFGLAISLMISTILVNNGYLMAALFLFFMIIIPLSNISIVLIMKNLAMFWFFFLLIILIPALTENGFVLFKIRNIYVYKQGLLNGLFQSVRFGLIIIIAALYNTTTSCIETADAISSILRPLGDKFSNKVAIMVSITLRFVPILQQEARRILITQKARGAFLQNGFIKRMLQIFSLMIPTFNSVIQKADTISMALDIKGYRYDVNRTQYKQLKIKTVDYVLFFCSILLLGFIIMMRWR